MAVESMTIEPHRGFDVDEFLEREQAKELLRFTTAGSVDDGKSTLIGRLLYDSRNVYEDQVRSVAKASVNRSAGGLDLSLLTDGLRAEREQGITIDVAYRYFGTARRRFIIADTPGHEQYTRNMATGASTADAAIILVDARQGILEQSCRHAYIAASLGIPRFAIAVNKMDLVEFSQSVFRAIEVDFRRFLETLNVTDAYFLPISALLGDNVVERSPRMAWFDGPSLLEHLETVELPVPDRDQPFRFSVQRVVRPGASFRGYAGQIASGVVRPGDEVMTLPSRFKNRVKAIATYDGNLQCAFPPMAVTLTLTGEMDISRGDLICSPADPPQTGRKLAARMVWMHEEPLTTGGTYLVKHLTQQIRAEILAVDHRVNVRTLGQEAASSLSLNEIGVVEMEMARPLFFDSYRKNRLTGSLILIDPRNNATVGAGMILRAVADGRIGRRAATVALGPRENVARIVERRLFDQGRLAAVVRDRDIAEAIEQAGLIALLLAGPERCPALTDEAAASEILATLGGSNG